MIDLDAYNLSFMLMDKWRKIAMRASSSVERMHDVPVYVEKNGELIRVTDVVEENGKIIIKAE